MLGVPGAQKQSGIFVAITNNTSFMPKIIRILKLCSMKIFSTFPTSKLNY